MFIMARNAGKKTLFEFKDLRDDYLQYLSTIESKTDYNTPPPCYGRKKYSFWIRPDILQTLETINDKTSFIENALLEKFERDQIPFPPAQRLSFCENLLTKNYFFPIIRKYSKFTTQLIFCSYYFLTIIT